MGSIKMWKRHKDANPRHSVLLPKKKQKKKRLRWRQNWNEKRNQWEWNSNKLMDSRKTKQNVTDMVGKSRKMTPFWEMKPDSVRTTLKQVLIILGKPYYACPFLLEVNIRKKKLP